MNPYDRKTDLASHLLYCKGWKAGNLDRIMEQPEKCGREWSRAYSWGYRDGYEGA